MIEQRPLFKLGVFNLRVNREQRPRHLQHVVDIATLIRATLNPVAELVRRTKIFVTTVTTRGVAVMQRDCVPEKLRGRAVRLITGVDVPREIANHLWHLGVSMQTRKDVFVSRQWITHGLMIEMMREI